MSTHHIIQSGNWQMEIPADWEEPDPDSDRLYFESADGEKGLYLLSIHYEAGEDAHSVADELLALDAAGWEDDPSYEWQIPCNERLETDAGLIHYFERYDPVLQYRIVTKLLVRLPVVVRGTFHDYACTDHETSRVWFSRMIASLELHA
ncbi:hypothetical protein [Chitinilyticum aquatile]|uniref:hypothetical protein n=1 Tax=Chitinilyticum aquatile TaxID=362520 RepID=UPI000422684B|nr:hypothetical protein [Chitinilyticum aquatile]